MKVWLAALLAVLLVLTGAAACAVDYRVAAGNEERFATLLDDMLAAYATPSEDDASRLEADLAAIRALSDGDYEIARSILEHWRRVYLDDGYPLYLYDGGERATALEEAGIRDGDIQAIVVLGYELRNGGMTEELTGRCDAAAAVARSFPGAILVCSGGATGENNPKGHTEAGLMKAYLTERCGIDGARIFIDERAMTTVENALNTFEILKSEGIGTVTIVTSAYHQRRGQAIYNAVGALYARQSGYAPQIVANYCLDVKVSEERARDDVKIAVRQLGEILNLPKKGRGGK